MAGRSPRSLDSDYDCCITERSSLKELSSKFLLPGTIWQLKCFVRRQPELANLRLGGANDAITIEKVSKSTALPSDACHTPGLPPLESICGNLAEIVDAQDFNYYYSVRLRTEFDPWRDMNALYYSKARGRFTPPPSLCQPCTPWWCDGECCPIEVQGGSPDREEWFFQKTSILKSEWGIDSLSDFARVVFGLSVYDQRHERFSQKPNIGPAVGTRIAFQPWHDHRPTSFRYNDAGLHLGIEEQSHIDLLRSYIQEDSLGPNGHVKHSQCVWNWCGRDQMSALVVVEEERVTGKVIQINISTLVNAVRISCHHLSGREALPSLELPTDATVSSLEAIIQSSTVWTFMDSSTGDFLGGRQLLKDHASILAKEFESYYHFMACVDENW